MWCALSRERDDARQCHENYARLTRDSRQSRVLRLLAAELCFGVGLASGTVPMSCTVLRRVRAFAFAFGVSLAFGVALLAFGVALLAFASSFVESGTSDL